MVGPGISHPYPFRRSYLLQSAPATGSPLKLFCQLITLHIHPALPEIIPQHLQDQRQTFHTGVCNQGLHYLPSLISTGHQSGCYAHCLLLNPSSFGRTDSGPYLRVWGKLLPLWSVLICKTVNIPVRQEKERSSLHTAQACRAEYRCSGDGG